MLNTRLRFVLVQCHIIRDRANAGMTQRELADRAGIRVETLCRIEAGKHTPSMATMVPIDKALKQAERQPKAKKR